VVQRLHPSEIKEARRLRQMGAAAHQQPNDGRDRASESVWEALGGEAVGGEGDADGKKKS
jgi:hypothetical protein